MRALVHIANTYGLVAKMRDNYCCTAQVLNAAEIVALGLLISCHVFEYSIVCMPSMFNDNHRVWTA